MKKLFFLMAFAFMCQVAFAQVKWGVYGGISASMFKDESPKSYSGNGISVDFDNTRLYQLTTYNLGVFVEPNIYKNLFLETGVYFGQRGFHKEVRQLSQEGFFMGDDDYIMPYLGVPVTLNYYLINKRFKLLLLAGQKTGFCFDGKIVSENGKKESFDVGEDGVFKSFHYDLNFGGGVGWGRFYLMATYDLGLLNVSNVDLFKYKSRVFNLSLKIDFSKKQKEKSTN